MTAEDRPVQSIVRRGTLSGMSDTRCCIGEGYTRPRARCAEVLAPDSRGAS